MEEKVLQKFTDFDSITTVKEVKKLLSQKMDRDTLFELLDNVYRRYYESIDNRDGKEYELSEMVAEIIGSKASKDTERQFRNETYERNHSEITTVINNYILQNRSFPTTSHIARKTGLSRQTVYNHLSAGLSNQYNVLVKGGIDYMVSNAMTKLYLIGVQDNNAGALKNFIELSGAMNQPKNTINNYIQINNLQLSKEEFEQLPNDTILEIERLVSQQILKLKKVQE